ncbi:MAG TPA: hypothetical protein VG815_19750 [Chloroflexota bacterium]|jgi:hypothetical protein|nr:hypothetical protein [Chloroflexota bacterium]
MWRGNTIGSRPGKDYIVYSALLDRAHQSGLRRIATTLLQAPDDSNGMVAIVSAQVETERGVFDGIGDANPQNVSRSVASHLIRMAETRAKARALRDAVNVGEDDLESEHESIGTRLLESRSSATYSSGSRQAESRVFSPAAAHRPAGHTTGLADAGPELNSEDGGRNGNALGGASHTSCDGSSLPQQASEHQLGTIARLSRLLGLGDQADAGLTTTEASERISELAQAFNDRKRPSLPR